MILLIHIIITRISVSFFLYTKKKKKRHEAIGGYSNNRVQ